jgi:hypothetical protein
VFGVGGSGFFALAPHNDVLIRTSLSSLPNISTPQVRLATGTGGGIDALLVDLINNPPRNRLKAAARSTERGILYPPKCKPYKNIVEILD